MSGNNVRGPTSALTEFLRSSGITATTIARRVATRVQTQTPNQQDQAIAGPSTSSQNATAESSSRRVTRRRSTRASGYASDELDDDEEPAVVPAEDKPMDEVEDEAPNPAKKRKLSKAALAKSKEAAKANAKKGAKKGADNDMDDEEDPYNALSRSMWTNESSARPSVGSFEDCAVCQKQFTVTKYTLAANPPPGFLCHQCAKAGGKDPFKKPAPKKRKAAADKRTAPTFDERRFPSLVTMCIQLITKHINDIEALGDIGTMNVEAISKALSKNRGLTPENAHLFYSATNTSLVLYDATNLTSPALHTLALLNPALTSLRLDFCGHLDSSSFPAFCDFLPHLTSIELLGPFLIRIDGWIHFFEKHPCMERFLITQSPRFDLECVKTLVKHCTGLKALRLKEVGKLSDEFLEELEALNQLEYLDLADPSTSCSENAVSSLLTKVGGKLKHLDLSGHKELSDEFLFSLASHTGSMESLALNGLLEITNTGLAEFFGEWGNPPLTKLTLARNSELGGPALQALLEHSGAQLEELSINGWKDTDEESLRMIGFRAPKLKRVDVGWCRAMDDFIVKSWMEGDEGPKRRGDIVGRLDNLREMKVWGCNKITDACPRKAGVNIYGVESHISR
ncbi:hypothetical protein BDQ12DRAFT_737547 [Crucibulum laeve]|uniref:RNI-like protein n=1 Tax=Crucibulum laeve TaxID=68775 RepID=A0A5C3LST2_9AGAR|nr:hypothetical protein BDQ12DRAFT_737547 [Crucibulum laeve]